MKLGPCVLEKKPKTTIPSCKAQLPFPHPTCLLISKIGSQGCIGVACREFRHAEIKLDLLQQVGGGVRRCQFVRVTGFHSTRARQPRKFKPPKDDASSARGEGGGGRLPAPLGGAHFNLGGGVQPAPAVGRKPGRGGGSLVGLGGDVRWKGGASG
jgi:hypothetical protein